VKNRPCLNEDMGVLYFLSSYGSRCVYMHTLTGLSATKHLTVTITFLDGFAQLDFVSIKWMQALSV